MIFIRPVHGTAVGGSNIGDPWTQAQLSAVGANNVDWELKVPSVPNPPTNPGIRPVADLYHTCPFGAQFEFEHYIPSS